MSPHRPTIAVLGGGRWARALWAMLHRHRDEAAAQPDAPGRPAMVIDRLMYHRPATAGSLSTDEARGAVELPSEPIEQLAHADLIILAAPAFAVRGILRQASAHLHGAQVLIHAIGSLAPEEDDKGQRRLLTDVIVAETPIRRVGVLAGPALPQDLEEQRPAALICGSRFDDVGQLAYDCLSGPRLRVYTTRDQIGVEVARAAVSPIALCGGLASTLELGIAARSILVTRGAAEMSRIGVALGGQEKTFFGLAGIGEMIVATDGRGSADYELGRLLATGHSLADAQVKLARICDAPSMVAEATRLAAIHQLRLPICHALARLFSGELHIRDMVSVLIKSGNHAE